MQQPLEISKSHKGYTCDDPIEALVLALKGWKPIIRRGDITLFPEEARKALGKVKKPEPVRHQKTYPTPDYNEAVEMLAQGYKLMKRDEKFWYFGI